jgi:shikimate dehydrogenase
MKTYGIVAHPVSHSLSPPMQEAAFKHVGENAEFLRFDIHPEALEHFILDVRQKHISGLAVSLPHKEHIISLLDTITQTAKDIGAVNTLFWKDGRLWGDNTDAEGFLQALKYSHSPLSLTDNSHVAVIGAGGAARAIVYALRNTGKKVTIFNRTKKKAEKLAQDFGAKGEEISHFFAKQFSLVINATSVGLREEKSPIPSPCWKGFSGIAFDAVFDPLYTKFLQDAKIHGANIITGEKMLLHQGMRQFSIWTDMPAPKDVMMSALKNTL